MSNISFVGDCHGNFKRLHHIINWTTIPIIQLGDLGIGFPDGCGGVTDFRSMSAQFMFLRGNHDNPELCSKNNHYLGDFGIDKRTGVFFVSGAYSIDKQSRTIGTTWWELEELPRNIMEIALEFYCKRQPNIVASHDCPYSVYKHLGYPKVEKSRTNQFFDVMLEHWKPNYWVFGHHHYNWTKRIDNIQFICVGELEQIEVNT